MASQESVSTVGSDRPVLGFRAWRYALNRVHFLYRQGLDQDWYPRDFTWQLDNPPARGDHYFGRVRVSGREASDGPLQFRVETLPDKSNYELCYCPLHETDRSCKSEEPVCHELVIAVTERGGLLHVVAPAALLSHKLQGSASCSCAFPVHGGSRSGCSRSLSVRRSKRLSWSRRRISLSLHLRRFENFR